MQTVALLALAAIGVAAPRQDPQALGYPITVHLDQGRCKFLIQDMWMGDPLIVERWLTSLPNKTQQIDIVFGAHQDRQCVEPARSAAQRSGFTSIVVRSGSPDDYPDQLRATASSS